MRIAQSLLIVGLVALTACSDATTTDETAEPPALSDAERKALVAQANAPLFEGMGDHHHPITTSSSGAQRYFNRL